MTAHSLDNLENLLFERDGAVATITINRPKVLNALNGQTLDELRRQLDHHAVEARLDATRQSAAHRFVVQIDMHMGQDRALRLQAFDPGKRLIQ